MTAVVPTQQQRHEGALEKKMGGGEDMAGDNDTSSSGSSPPPGNGAQLTIFYAGSVSVFDGITPDRAHAILRLAAAAAAGAAPELKRSLSVQSVTGPFDREGALPALPPAAPPQPLLMLPTTPNSLCAELPLARRNSLQLFLEKRRERLVKSAPYMVQKMQETPPGGSFDGSEPCISPMNGWLQ